MINKQTASSKIAIYFTNNCPQCKRLKQLLKEVGVEYKELELTVDVTAELITKHNIHLYSAPGLRIGNLMFSVIGEVKKDE